MLQSGVRREEEKRIKGEEEKRRRGEEQREEQEEKESTFLVHFLTNGGVVRSHVGHFVDGAPEILNQSTKK